MGEERSPERAFELSLDVPEGSLVAQTVKNLPAMCETQVCSLGWEDPLKKDVLAIINSAAMNIGVLVSLSLLVFSVCMPSSGIAGS